MEHEKFYSFSNNRSQQFLFPSGFWIFVSKLVLSKNLHDSRTIIDEIVSFPSPSAWNHRSSENVKTHVQISVSKIGAESERGERSSVHEPRRDRSAHAKLARRPACAPNFDVWSMPGNGWGLLLRVVPTPERRWRRRNHDKGAKKATRRQSSLLTPHSRFSRRKDRSECQITARQRRQRLFLYFPFDEGKGTVADELVTSSLQVRVYSLR